MDINIGMKHQQIVKLRDELTQAIDGNPEGRDGRTEVTLYLPGGDSHSDAVGQLTISNDDMERAEVMDGQVYAEISR